VNDQQPASRRRGARGARAQLDQQPASRRRGARGARAPRVNPPSPAAAIACVALFVALGGVSYGFATGTIDSREIADNTVRSKDIRNNGVYARDIRNNDVRDIDIRNGTIKGRDVARATLTGDNINLAKLGRVPDSAALGGVAASGYATSAEPLRLVGTTGQPPFEANFSASGGSDLAPGFWKAAGMVWLQGTVATAAPGVAFALPAGYRPAGDAHFGEVDVDADGDVHVPTGPASLDGIAFRVD
jgi:hypothetical protein